MTHLFNSIYFIARTCYYECLFDHLVSCDKDRRLILSSFIKIREEPERQKWTKDFLILTFLFLWESFIVSNHVEIRKRDSTDADSIWNMILTLFSTVPIDTFTKRFSALINTSIVIKYFPSMALCTRGDTIMKILCIEMVIKWIIFPFGI